MQQTRELWLEARGKTFFLTGGTGFFGRWLVESFLRCNDVLELQARMLILSRNPDVFLGQAPQLARHSALSFLRGDVATFSFPVLRADYVIHAAAPVNATTNQLHPEEVLAEIVRGTEQVLAFSQQARVGKLLLISSGGVYGPQPESVARIPEDFRIAAQEKLSGYSAGKRRAEEIASAHAATHGYEMKIARCFSFVGPHLPFNGHFALGNFMRDALADDWIRVAGDGSPLRSYLYMADLTTWLWTILFRAPAQRAFNVGSDKAISIRDLATMVDRLRGGRPGMIIAGEPTKALSANRYVPSIARAKDELGLHCRVPLPEALSKTFTWYKTS